MNGRLVYFLSFGVAVIFVIFVYYCIALREAPAWSSHTIEVTRERQDALAAAFKQSWQRNPGDQEMQDLIAAWAQEEMAFRAGMSQNIGSDDITVRRRVQELLENRTQASSASAGPTDATLSEFLEANADRFRVDETITFKQVFYDIDANGIGADAAARFMLNTLQNQDMPEDLSKYGDPTGLPVVFESISESDIRSLLGDSFATALREIKTGRWTGPLRSRQGLHLVYIEERSGGRTPTLDEVRGAVEREYLADERAAALDRLYEELSSRYKVVID